MFWAQELAFGLFDQMEAKHFYDWCIHNINYLTLSPTKCVGPRGSTGRVFVLRTRGSEIEPRRMPLFFFFLQKLASADRTFIFQSFGPFSFNGSIPPKTNPNKTIQDGGHRSSPGFAPCLGHFLFLLFPVSFLLRSLPDVRGVPFGTLFFRSTRNSLPNEPTPTFQDGGRD